MMGRQLVRQIVAVFLGGLLGGAIREMLMLGIQLGKFPLNTMIVNLTGVFLTVLVTTTVCQRWHGLKYMREFVDVGILGAYTTYGTIILDVTTKTSLLEGGIYLVVTIVGSVLMVYLARFVGERGMPCC